MSDVITQLNAALAGRYTIERQLGAGGMATVYLARDERHGRRVAVKILESDVSAVVGPDRFLAEVRTTAGLQHPNILPLHDSGEAGPFLFYVMPYIEGESLRDRLDRERQLPVGEAVRITSDVAEALDYAHRQKVVHRDVKPENILLHEGRALIADFGIALAVRAAGEDHLTSTGVSVGTPRYMSPEQLEARPGITGRSDLYSLGVVLYEMLAGEPPHARAGPWAVLAEEPRPVSEIRRSVPPHVVAALARVLEKIPADRFGTGAEFAEALRDSSYRWPPGLGRSRVPQLVTAAGIAALAAIALWGWLRPAPSSSEARAVQRAVIPLPNGRTVVLQGGNRNPIAISRDGRRIAYVQDDGQSTRIYVRDLQNEAAEAVPGTDNARQPFFSPDGSSLGFFSGTELRRVSLAGGIPSRIATVPPSPRQWFGATWGPDGIVFSLSESLWRVAADGRGGATEIPLFMDAADGLVGTSADSVIPRPIRWPRMLPGGRHVLVSVGWEDDVGVTGVIEIESGRFRPLVVGGEPHYVPPGHLVVASRDERVSVVPFDLDGLRLTGNPRDVLQGVARGPGGAATSFTVSENGTLIFIRGGLERTLFLVDRFGRADSIEVDRRGFRFPSLAPDGRTLAITVDPRPSQVWILDIERGTARAFTTEGYHLGPAFSRDGARLAFNTPGAIVWTTWPGPDSLRTILSDASASDWFSDSTIAGVTERTPGNRDIVRIEPETGRLTPVVAGPGNEFAPAVSPDGQWLAYVDDHTGTQDVYLRRIDRNHVPLQVSRGGGADPRWAPSGGQLFYRSANWIVSVSVTAEQGSVALGPPDSLFAGPFIFSQVGNWDVTPDGRFLMIRGDPGSGSRIEIVFNWPEELASHAGRAP